MGTSTACGAGGMKVAVPAKTAGRVTAGAGFQSHRAYEHNLVPWSRGSALSAAQPGTAEGRAQPVHSAGAALVVDVQPLVWTWLRGAHGDREPARITVELAGAPDGDWLGVGFRSIGRSIRAAAEAGGDRCLRRGTLFCPWLRRRPSWSVCRGSIPTPRTFLRAMKPAKPGA